MSLINVPIEIASLTEAEIYAKFSKGKKYTGAKTPKEFLNEQVGLMIQSAIYDADINEARDNAIIGIVKPPVVVDGQPVSVTPKAVIAEEIIN